VVALTPSELRPHLNILDDGDAIEDVLLQTFIDAAFDYMVRYTRRDLQAEFPTGLPADLLLVQKLLASHYFGHREALSAKSLNVVPLGIRDLLADFRSFL